MHAPRKPVMRNWVPRKGWAYGLWLLPVTLGFSWILAQPATGTERVSIRSDGGQANGPSNGPVAGSFADCVPFYSDATNLVPNQGDSNGVRDVYSFNTITDMQERVSVSFDGGQPNKASQAQGFRPSVDHACTCVAFSSDATNIVLDDTNRATDVFLRDLLSQTNERVSVGFEGQANGPSSFASVDEGCARIAFQSTATNLVPEDTNNTSDIFVRNTTTNETTRVSVGGGGEQADGASITPGISANGRCVAFASAATNLLPPDTNRTIDIYVACDGVVTCRASVDSNGAEANNVSFLPQLSSDGNLVVFKSLANNLVPGDFNDAADVFVHNCATGETERVSVGDRGQEGNDNSFPATISDDGRFVAFGSFASNLILGLSTGSNAQIYVRDREQETTVLISRSLSGGAQNGSSPDLPPSISPDGNFVAFASLATNLVPNDTNMVMDAFVANLPCEDEGDCPPGSMCVNGECVPPATPTPTPTPECDDMRMCPEGEVCTPDGMCATPTPTGTPTPTAVGTCATDDDCEPPEICVSGRCITPRPSCTTDDDCVVPCEETADCSALATPPPRECVDGFCDPADRCRSMRCVPPRMCDDHSQCLATEACVDEDGDGFCECGGDCNLDGVVVGTEISTMINILAGAAPLEVCPAADIDGDGEVTGFEIVLAISNLAQGCPDLLMPLDNTGVGQSRAEEVTLEIDSASAAPGDTVTLKVGLTGGMSEVVMAQLDLLYDPSVLTVADPETACQLDSRLTQQVVRAARPATPPAPAGKQRLRVFVGDVSVPVAPFADGAILSCSFQVNSDAKGGVTSVTADRVGVSDPKGNAFGTTSTEGLIEVVAPTAVPEATSTPEPEPTNPPPPDTPTALAGECTAAGDCRADRREACVGGECRCAGDCNGDGNAAVNELVAAIGILLGQSPGSACPAADVDGDGNVTVDELVVGVGNVTVGCP